MITIYNNLISKNECEELINYYQENSEKVFQIRNDIVYHYDGMYITEDFQKFTFTKRFLENDIPKLRIQRLDNTINMVEIPHGHATRYNFVAFLNEDFEGGELMFGNITFKPAVGQLIYFTGNELHYVKKVYSGNRYTLIGMSTSDIPILKSTLL